MISIFGCIVLPLKVNVIQVISVVIINCHSHNINLFISASVLKFSHVDIVNKATSGHNLFLIYLFLAYPRREWRILHNEELNDLYSSPNIVWVIKYRRMRWAGHVARMGEERGVYRVLLGKPEGRRPLGRPRRRWVDNIRTNLQEVGYGYMDSIGLAQDRDKWRTLVSGVMNLRAP